MSNECQECGMAVVPNAYHPYAACLMFKGCGDAATVEANLNVVMAFGAQASALCKVHGEAACDCLWSPATGFASPASGGSERG